MVPFQIIPCQGRYCSNPTNSIVMLLFRSMVILLWLLASLVALTTLLTLGASFANAQSSDDCAQNTSTACTITVGESLSVMATLHSAGDRDWWRLDFGDATMLMDVTVYDTGGVDTDGTLYEQRGGTGSVSAVSDWADQFRSSGNRFRVVRGNVNPGENTYYVEVRSRNWSGGTNTVYNLHVKARPDSRDDCANNAARTSCVISVGEPMTAHIDYGRDPDWWRLDFGDITAAPVFINIHTSGDYLYTKGTLYEKGARANLISIDSDGYEFVYKDFQITHNDIAPDENTYYIKVGDNFNYYRGEYTLHMDAWPASILENGCADGTATMSCTLSAGEPVTAHIDSRTDEDWWRLDFGDATTPMRITIYTTTDDAVDPWGMLFEQSGGAEPVLIAQNNNGGDGRNFRIVYNNINPGENTYYIKVEGVIDFRLGVYTLHFDTGPNEHRRLLRWQPQFRWSGRIICYRH